MVVQRIWRGVQDCVMMRMWLGQGSREARSLLELLQMVSRCPVIQHAFALGVPASCVSLLDNGCPIVATTLFGCERCVAYNSDSYVTSMVDPYMFTE